MNDYKIGFAEYQEVVEQLQEKIRPELPEDGTLDGREWCDEHDIPEQMFADAINWSDFATYGISPMYPFKEP